jgi:hypothetical protein
MGINATYIQGYANSITGIINDIIVPVLISIAFLVFIYGIYKYFIAGASDEKKRSEGKTFSLYGIIGFVVLFAVWGIVNIFGDTLGLYGYNAPAFPTIGNTTGTQSTIPASGSGASANPLGTGTPTAGNTSGMTVAQSSNYSALQQQLTTLNVNCPYGTAQAATASCQQQIAAYQQNVDNYNAMYPASGSGSVAGAVGSTCTDSSTCSGTLTCQNGKCAALGGILGSTCADVSDCSGNLVCTNGQCTNPSSSSGTTSTGLPNGSSCTLASQCSGGYCNTDPDSGYSTCASNSSSATSATTNNQSDGTVCTSGAQCISGYCSPTSSQCAEPNSTPNSCVCASDGTTLCPDGVDQIGCPTPTNSSSCTCSDGTSCPNGTQSSCLSGGGTF